MRHILRIIVLLLAIPLFGWAQSSGVGPFSLTAPASATTNVQWFKNGTTIAGATSVSYSTGTTGVYWASYDITTPNSCSGLVSDYNVVLQQGDADIKSLIGPSGQTAYQWYKDGAAISGATSTSLSLPNAVSAVGTYYLIYNNGSCDITTGNFYVYVLLAIPPTIAITTPNNVTITATNPPISGTTTALASVTVNAPNGQTCFTTADASGNWTCTSLTFTVGVQTVTAIASNTGGLSNTATSSFTVVSSCANPSVGGTVAFGGVLPLCSTGNVGTVTLSGQTGSVVKWQTSTDGGVTFTDIANTTTSLSFANAQNNQQYRAVVNNGAGCGNANASPVTITTSAGACAIACTVLPDTIAK